MKNLVQLTTYADRLGGGDLESLKRILEGLLSGVFGGMHILPFFYPIDGADAGFDPIDHTRVDPRLGDWGSIRRLGGMADIMADLIVNHVSSDSPQFQDFSERGESSPYAGMFLTLDHVFPGGASESNLLKIYRPRPGLPFTCVSLKDGSKRILWTTFTPKQIDINVGDPKGEAYLHSILERFSENGVRMIRLDAVGYAIKKSGTSCFMIPETYAFIGQLTKKAHAMGMEVLVEIHSYYKDQVEVAKSVDWVYDFALPPLVLHALFEADSGPLRAWLAISPRNAITVLDTHDGIGVMDVGASAATGQPGLLPPDSINRLVDSIHANSNGGSRLATGAAASNLDLYQVNCTYFDALGRDANAYIIARAIQFFAPGVPQVYYTGLLAGENDVALLERTRVGRDINRHYFGYDEVIERLRKPVVQRLIDLIRFRNSHDAFNGDFSMPEVDPRRLILVWRKGSEHAILNADLSSRTAFIEFTNAGKIVRKDLSS